MISVTVDISKFEAFINRAMTFVVRDARMIAAKTAINAILSATREGIDAYGEVFRHYASRTVKERLALGLRVDIVNLYVTGRMLGSLGKNGNPDGTVTFSAEQLNKAVNNILLGRDFIGPGPHMLSEVKTSLEEGMLKIA